jgi:hypothetical protein
VTRVIGSRVVERENVELRGESVEKRRDDGREVSEENEEYLFDCCIGSIAKSLN